MTKKIIIRGQARRVTRMPTVVNRHASIFRPRKGKGAYNRAAQKQDLKKRVMEEIASLGGKIYG